MTFDTMNHKCLLFSEQRSLLSESKHHPNATCFNRASYSVNSWKASLFFQSKTYNRVMMVCFSFQTLSLLFWTQHEVHAKMCGFCRIFATTNCNAYSFMLYWPLSLAVWHSTSWTWGYVIYDEMSIGGCLGPISPLLNISLLLIHLLCESCVSMRLLDLWTCIKQGLSITSAFAESGGRSGNMAARVGSLVSFYGQVKLFLR